MLRSMYSGISGLRNHQTRMDVVGNNIANVNTVGFKKSRVTFQDILSQTIRGGASPDGNRGGTNPQQVGLGMGLGSIDTIHSPGNLQTTGKMTDLAIEGDGFFLVGTAEGQTFYTRAGAFDFDRDGNYRDPNGMLVKGWMADENGRIDTNAISLDSLVPIKLSVGVESGAKATDKIVYNKNIDSRLFPINNDDLVKESYLSDPADPATEVNVEYSVGVPMEFYDENGRGFDVQLLLKPAADINQWEYAIRVKPMGHGKEAWRYGNAPAAGATNPPAAWGTLEFSNDGKLIEVDGDDDILHAQLTVGNNIWDGLLVNDQTITLDFSQITQLAAPMSVQADTQNGYPSGTLQSVTVDSSGVILGVFSNGQTRNLAQVAMANFNNPGGLISQGGNLYTVSNNSGNPQIGTAGTGGRGTIAPGSLEMSNVDLSEEFVDMITTQRGFQANSRIITTSDEMLQELVNLKR